MNDTNSVTADVIIIGGGLAGAMAATVLARQGVRVVLIEPRAVHPACFKAEKIEPDQADGLRRIGMFQELGATATRIREILCVQPYRRLGVLEIEQYGMYYHDMVNRVLEQMPPTIQWRQARAEKVSNSDDLQQVTLETGEVVTSRLVVLASGTVSGLASSLDLRRDTLAKDFSVAFGFTIARHDGKAFDFDAVTYYPLGSSTKIGFLTLFPIGDVMRANLFVFRSINEEWVRRFLKSPDSWLRDNLPKLSNVIGDFDIVSKVETGRIHLYRVRDPQRPGLVLLGDSYQSVCPSTGTGLSKVFTDVEVLCLHCVPAWLATPGMGVDKTARFYQHPQKRAVDNHSLKAAFNQRGLSTTPSLWWKVRASVHYELKRLYLRFYLNSIRRFKNRLASLSAAIPQAHGENITQQNRDCPQVPRDKGVALR